MPKVSTLLEDGLMTVSSENLFTLSIDRRDSHTLIHMQLLIPQVNTREFPLTTQLLQLYLPSIFHSTCYNDEGLPIAKEVTQTEVGHLFEHILLEYLCIGQLEKGFEQATYEGVTDWNWITEPKGTFHITIQTQEEENTILLEAIERAVVLTNIILTNDESLKAKLPIPAQRIRH